MDALERIRKQLEDRRAKECPHIIRRSAGDETYDICELNTKACLIEHGLYKCETWEEIQDEWARKEIEMQKASDEREAYDKYLWEVGNEQDGRGV